MILAIDVKYYDNVAKAVGVLFNSDDSTSDNFIITYVDTIEEYIPGEFYKRELPCIQKIMEQVDLETITIIIVDGHVFVDNFKKYGLGGFLWEQLNEKIPVIGVAKNPYYQNSDTVQEIIRGESGKPLYVSAIGMDLTEAADLIKNMKGMYRIPTILKDLDKVTKEQ